MLNARTQPVSGETWLQSMFLSKMGVSSEVSLLGGQMTKGFSASECYGKAKQIALTVLSTLQEENAPESVSKTHLSWEGLGDNYLFLKTGL